MLSVHFKCFVILCYGGLLSFALVGCVDIRGYQGQWEGNIIAESAVREGFSTNTHATLILDTTSLRSISGKLSTNDGQFQNTPLISIAKASNDILADFELSGDPLRNYLLYANLSTEENAPSQTALLVVSIFPDDQIELRILKDNSLFGVFPLKRKE